MPVESASFISDLDETYPLSDDRVNKGDDHLRLIKAAIKATFPNLNAAVSASPAELNKLAGLATTATELALLNGLLATTIELNLLQGKTGLVDAAGDHTMAGELTVIGGIIGDLTGNSDSSTISGNSSLLDGNTLAQILGMTPSYSTPDYNFILKTSSGSYDKPANLLHLDVITVGSGGGGGGSGANFTYNQEVYSGGQGGTGGSPAVNKMRIQEAGLSASETLTIGSGGGGGNVDSNGSSGSATSFGAFVSISGGTGGTAGSDNSTTAVNGTTGAVGVSTPVQASTPFTSTELDLPSSNGGAGGANNSAGSDGTGGFVMLIEVLQP